METMSQSAIEFDNDEAEHRQELIAALRAANLDAYEYHSGGGIMHVVVDLVNEEGGGDLLQIATGSAASLCDVGLMGWNERGGAESKDWIRTRTLQDVVEAFQRYWTKREEYIQRFKTGELDV